MVFRCPTCGRFVKTESNEGDIQFGTCGKCNIPYKARYSGGITESGDYDAWLTVWSSQATCEGKYKTWKLKGDW